MIPIRCSWELLTHDSVLFVNTICIQSDILSHDQLYAHKKHTMDLTDAG